MRAGSLSLPIVQWVCSSQLILLAPKRGPRSMINKCLGRGACLIWATHYQLIKMITRKKNRKKMACRHINITGLSGDGSRQAATLSLWIVPSSVFYSVTPMWGSAHGKLNSLLCSLALTFRDNKVPEGHLPGHRHTVCLCTLWHLVNWIFASVPGPSKSS